MIFLFLYFLSYESKEALDDGGSSSFIDRIAASDKNKFTITFSCLRSLVIMIKHIESMNLLYVCTTANKSEMAPSPKNNAQMADEGQEA
jgi:hypothetical protein